MREILLLLFCGIMTVCAVLLWIKDRTDRKQAYRKQEEREKEYLLQKEKADAYIRELRKELSLAGLERRERESEIEELEERQAEKVKAYEDRQADTAEVLMKIHIYAQLLREQSQSAPAQGQCDIILRECERLMGLLPKELLGDKRQTINVGE